VLYYMCFLVLFHIDYSVREHVRVILAINRLFRLIRVILVISVIRITRRSHVYLHHLHIDTPT
jgi:hypothetical protein